MKQNMKKEEPADRGLIDLVFSWPVKHVLNQKQDLYQVYKIPETFRSTTAYMNSFINPLIEETRADLQSSMKALSQAPTCKICSVETSKGYKPPKKLLYNILIQRMRDSGKDEEKYYEPEVGDLIALTDSRHISTEDLLEPEINYQIALVQGKDENSDELLILASKPIVFEEGTQNSRTAIYLINMTTYNRIWRRLNFKAGNMNIIRKVLRTNSTDGGNCADCFSEVDSSVEFSNMKAMIQSFDLNDSQETAVLSCIATRTCHHQNTVKLLWGPAGTGKTKTIGVILFSLLKMNCRTLTCAPTNIAVREVTKRLKKFVMESLECDTYGLGDIVLFGNEERLKIDGHDDLLDVFLDHRVEILSECFAKMPAWKNSLRSMILLLENPENQYGYYLNENRTEMEDKEEECEQNNGMSDNEKPSSSQIIEEFYDQKLKDEKSKKISKKHQASKKSKNKELDKMSPSLNEKQSKNEKKKDKKIKRELVQKSDDLLTFKEFVKKRFHLIGEQLKPCIVKLYTHLPTSIISLEVAKNMIKAVDLLGSLESLFQGVSGSNKGLKQVLHDLEGGSRRVGCFTKLSVTGEECLHVLRSLSNAFSVPKFSQNSKVTNFCLNNACLLFSTASCSAKLYTKGMMPLEFLVIDDAAQLKECESTIPLQLSGLCHAILVGDEKQLPAMVKSKISERADFGRSLFERLVLLGHKKHLLNIQYRMHPSISLFPNKEVYDGQVVDAPIVKERSYEKSFLQGNMYGAYSFINISNGIEEFNDGHSAKNIVEVAVVSEIIASLFKAKQKISIGVISPYNAQVKEIQEKLGKKYSTDAESDFSVSVRSIDGFQGGEEDVIIITTVRCNGSIGFLSKRQRANVALTRARYCLWILGNEETLIKSCSIWEKLIVDAKERGCFYNADEDKSLAQSIMVALVELHELDILGKMSPLFKDTIWKVYVSDNFWNSMVRIENSKFCKEILSLLAKLASGWRQSSKKRKPIFLGGTSSQLLELYTVKGRFNLIWSVDIVEENQNYIQVLKVWDVLQSPDVPNLAKRLDITFECYTVEKMYRCQFRCVVGTIVVPMRWPMDLCGETDPVHLSSNPFATLSLDDESNNSSEE